MFGCATRGLPLIAAIATISCRAPEASVPPSASAEPGASGPDSRGHSSTGSPASSEPAAPAAAEPASPLASAAPEALESEILARDFLKSGGRRIGYSATKKGFAYPLERRQDNGFSLDIQFTGEDGHPRDVMRVCQFGECEERLDEIIKELLPKLAARLEADSYVAVRGIGWPSGRDELEVSSLGMKLRYRKGRLEALREGKPPAFLAGVSTKKLDAPALQAIFLIPDSKLLGVSAAPGGDAKGLVQDFYVFKLP